MSRQERLRAELVAQVTPPRRSQTRFVIASALAFALAGVGTGGIVATAALAQNEPHQVPPALDLSDVQATGMQRAEDRGLEVLATFTVRGARTTELDLGSRPEGADSIIYSVQCLDHSDVVVTVGDVIDDSLSCVNDATWRIGSSRIAEVDADSAVVQLQGGRYAVWAAWTSGYDDPQLPNVPSPYLAYGVTRAEYLAAFGAFRNCLEGAGPGYQLEDVDTSGLFIEYSVGDADPVAVAYCYSREYGSVAEAWAEENAP